MGNNAPTNPTGFLLLAFFTVVASSPNLSTLLISAAKVRISERITK